MGNPLNILGLGRCGIGHLRRHGTTQFTPSELTFQHCYLLNFRTALDFHHEATASLHPDIVPPADQQLHWPDLCERSDLVVREIFPAAPLFPHISQKLWLCSEYYGDPMRESGFANTPQIITNQVIELTNVHQAVTNLIRHRNPATLQMFFFSEYVSPDMNEGNTELGIAASELFKHAASEKITWLDVRQIMEEFGEQQIAFAEYDYPYRYIQHQPDLTPIRIARDCKHSSHWFRQMVTNRFFQLAPGSLNFPVPPLRAPMAFDKFQRAERWVDEHKSLLAADWLSSHGSEISRFLQYMEWLGCGNKKLGEIFEAFLPSNMKRSDLLKSHLYHLRSITAHCYQHPDELATAWILRTWEELLQLPNETHALHYNFSLLWFKNLWLALEQQPLIREANTNRKVAMLTQCLCQHPVLSRYPLAQNIAHRWTQI